MSPLETLQPPELTKTARLDGHLRIRIELVVLGLFGIVEHHEAENEALVKKCQESLGSIVDEDEEVKQLAREGEIDQAAQLAKQRLEEKWNET